MTATDYWTKISLFVLRQEFKFLKLGVKRLHTRSLQSRLPAVAPDGPVVSLTTYGDRLNTVYLALESIASGTVLPSRLILWLDDRTAFEKRPLSIRRLESRGLEVYSTENYGPHTKYYPYLLSTDIFNTPLVTADDDVLYSKWWLEGLVHAHSEHADVVNCYRAHVIKIEGEEVGPYQMWKSCRSTDADFRHFATGVSGCIYPAELLSRLKYAGLAFQQVCPSADDIWLNVNALRGGFKVRQIRSRSLRFPLIPGTQNEGLWHSNVILSRNDEQIKRTYTAQDVSLLTSVCSDAAAQAFESEQSVGS